MPAPDHPKTTDSADGAPAADHGKPSAFVIGA